MRAFGILLFAYTLSQFYRSFLAVISSELARDIGLDAAGLGNVSAAWFVAFAVAQFPVGFALDAIGPRRTLAGFLLAALAGTVWLALAMTYWECMCAMCLIGAGCAPALMAAMYVFGRAYSFERFTLLSSTMIGLGTLGNILGASPLALAVEHIGWRGSIGIVAVLAAIGVALAALFLHDPRGRKPDAAHDSAWSGIWKIAGLRPLWPILPIVAVSYAVVIATRSLWISPFMAGVHGFDVSERGYAALIMALAMSVGALAYGPVERALGCKPAAVLGSAVTLAALLALGLWGDRNAALAVGLMAVAGGFGMSYAVLMGHARDFIPAHLLGRGVTFVNFVFIAGAGIVQSASGQWVEAWMRAGEPDAVIYSRLFLAYGFALLAALVVYLFAPTGASAARKLKPARPELVP